MGEPGKVSEVLPAALLWLRVGAWVFARNHDHRLYGFASKSMKLGVGTWPDPPAVGLPTASLYG